MPVRTFGTAPDERDLVRADGARHDGPVVAGAVESGAGILYSEDLQHGRRIESITVIDPFAADPDSPDA